ncbi:hypothetical protein PYJP_06290 [Pyrofollis japonicus]|uniref:hypothetical protein n=1 Tax=Pyrofollis japonicus TaxID=3060460 RepID=UPI00295B7AAE|nr:hypothetical protein [Pyrofollis japonicus]BEP17277.1 hypothetical protein PYJP_06290 [Pyrofollis japonicus]
MRRLPAHRTYCYALEGNISRIDPLLELLASPLLPIVRGERKYKVAKYCAEPITGTLAVRTESTVSHIHVLSIYKWLAYNPLTLMGDYNLAALVDEGALPGSGFFPLAERYKIYEDSSTYQKTLYLAPAATATNSSRRGIDLVQAMLTTTIILHGLDPSNLTRNTYEALVQAYLYKLSQLQSSELRYETLAVSKIAPQIPPQRLQTYISEIIQAKNTSEIQKTIRKILGDKSIINQLYGKYLGQHTITLPLSPEQQIQQFTRLVTNPQKLGTDTAIIEVTGQFSLADILLAANTGIQTVYLIATPETIQNIIHIMLLFQEKISKPKIEINNKEIIIDNITFKTIIVPQTIPTIISKLYTKIVEKSRETTYIPGFISSISALTIKQMQQRKIQIKTIQELIKT